MSADAITIELPLLVDGKRDDWLTVAEIVDVAPHLAHVATWAVHLNVFCWGLPWRISNVETGAAVKKVDAETREACIEAARKYLANKTAAQFVRRAAMMKKQAAA